MSMPNKQAIFHYIEKLKEVLARLLTFRAYSLTRLEKDTTLQWALDRGIQLAVECCIDIGEEIITGLNLRKPTTGGEVFDILAKRHIIPYSLGDRIKALVKYRNEIVHEYLIIDAKKNYRIVQKDLQYIEIYLKTIGLFLKKHKDISSP